MAARDPDAIWKPGYTGEVVYPDPAPARRRRRRRLAVIGAGFVAMLVAGLAVTRIVTRDGTGEPVHGESIPTQVRERWTARLDGPVVGITGAADTIVAVTGGDPALVALDADTGAERWRAPASNVNLMSMDVIDDVVVVGYFFAGAGSVAGFDLGTGRRLWSVPLGRDHMALVAGQAVVGAIGPIVFGVDVYDPRTGARIGSIEGDEVSISSRSVHRRDGDVIEVFDRTTLAPRTRVDLAELGLVRFRTAAAATDAGVVVTTLDKAMLLDGEGKVVSSLALSRKLDDPWVIDELDGSGRFLVLEGETRATILTVRDGRLSELWTRPAQVVDWFVDDTHQVLVIQPANDQYPQPIELVDASSGRTIWSTQDSTPALPWAFGELGPDGFIAAVEGEPPSTVGGYRLDGTRMWRLPVPERAWVKPVPGALVTVDVTTPASPTLTLFS